MNMIFDIQRFKDLTSLDLKVSTDKTHLVLEGTSSNDIISVSLPPALTTADNDKKILISGAGGNDRVYYTLEREGVTIDGGAGKDSIVAYAKNASIIGGAGNDVIYLNTDSSGAIIYGGTGNDKIYADDKADNGTGRTFVYNEGDGNDEIYGIKSGDTIRLHSEEVISSSYSGDDYIVNVGSGKITLKSASSIVDSVTFMLGNDAYTVPALIEYSESGDNTINSTSNVVVDLKKGDDIFSTTGNTVLVYGGAGNDSLISTGNDVTLDGGAGNDTIQTGGSGGLVNGGAGNDLITVNSGATGVTVNGGAGNDYIDAKNEAANTYIYGEGDGNDTIHGFHAGDTIQITAGFVDTNKAALSGNDFIIPVGKGTITLSDLDSAIETITIIDAKGETVSIAVPKTMTGTKKADNLANVKSGASEGSPFVIDALAGNDSITNSGSNVSISGGAGADLITLSSGTDYVTVNGGAGNDIVTIQGSDKHHLFEYASGDGNDVIYGLGANDTIKITSGSISSAEFSGSDYVLTVGKGTITLKDAKGGATFTTVDSTGATATATIPSIWQGTKAAETYATTADGYTVQGMAGNDTLAVSHNNVYADGGGDADIINVNGSNTGVKIYGGAGNDTITIESVVSGEGEEETTARSSQAHTFIYESGDGNDIIYGFNANDLISIASGSIDTAVSGNDFIITSGKGSITLKDVVGGVDTASVQIGNASVQAVPIQKIIQGTKNAETISNSEAGYLIDALAGNDSITVSGENNIVEAGVGNDIISVKSGVAGIKINGGTGNDVVTIDGGSADTVGRYYVFGASDGTDTIYGFNAHDTIEFANDTITTSISDSGENFILKSGKTSVVIANYFANGLSGETFTTLKAGTTGEIAPNATVPAILQGTKTADTLELTKDDHTVLALAGNDNITVNASNVSIDGGAGNDSISVSAGADSVTVNGGAGDDTVTIESGGEKAHTFVYADGDGSDVIYGYGANDAITITGGDYTTAISGKDFIISVGKGAITLKDAATLPRTTINGETVTIEQVIQGTEGNDSNLTVTESGYRVEGLAGNDTISLSADVTGTAVNGGTGDDYIYGNANDNVYIYASGDGKDTIENFTEGDTINITSGKVDSSVTSGTDVILNVGKGSITLKDAIGSVRKFNLKIGTAAAVETPITITGTAKADEIVNDASVYSIQALGGNDTIENYADSVTVEAGAGKDYIFNSGSKVQIFGDADNDTVESFGDSVTVDGGAGADYIYSDGNNASVGGGAGNDTLEIIGASITVFYANGDGNDIVYGFDAGDILQINSAQLASASVDGTDVILKIGNGYVKLMDMAGQEIKYTDSSGDKTTVVSGAVTGTARADKINNTYAGFTINALAGNDTVTNSGDNAVIDGGTGADLISNTGTGTSIFGGIGNDIITSTGNKVSIDGGFGHDKITIGSGSDSVTVTGGAGNDTITATGAENVLFNYASGDGRDVIVGFKAGDTLKVTSGSIASSVESGENVILKIGSGSVKLEGAKGKINISGTNVTYTGSGSSGNLAVPWFMEDDTSFIGGGATVDEITAPEYSVTNVETSDGADAISQLEKYMAAYGSDK